MYISNWQSNRIRSPGKQTENIAISFININKYFIFIFEKWVWHTAPFTIIRWKLNIAVRSVCTASISTIHRPARTEERGSRSIWVAPFFYHRLPLQGLALSQLFYSLGISGFASCARLFILPTRCHHCRQLGNRVKIWKRNALCTIGWQKEPVKLDAVDFTVPRISLPSTLNIVKFLKDLVKFLKDPHFTV